MRIEIQAGDVAIRSAECIEHSRAVFTLEFFTPFDSAVACDFRYGWTELEAHVYVDVYAPRRREPSKIILAVSHNDPRECGAWFRGILLYTSEARNRHTVLALPRGILDGTGGTRGVARGDFRVDYLESEFT